MKPNRAPRKGGKKPASAQSVNTPKSSSGKTLAEASALNQTMRWGAGRSFDEQKFFEDTFQIMGAAKSVLVRDLEGNLFLKEARPIGANVFEIPFAEACQWIAARSNWKEPGKLLRFHGIVSEPSQKTVQITMVNRGGEHSTLDVSPEMAERMKASQSIRLERLGELEGGGFAGRLVVGAGIHDAIVRYAQRSGIGDFYAAFTKLMQAGLRRAECHEDMSTALSDADSTAQELKLLFESLRRLMNLWQMEGMPTKERFGDIDCGLIAQFSRIEKSLEQNIRALRNAI